MPNLVRTFDDPPGPTLDLFVSVDSTLEAEMIEQGIPVPPLIPVHTALVDTGSKRTMIAVDVLKELGLDPVAGETAGVGSPFIGNGSEEMDVYSVNLVARRPPIKNVMMPGSYDIIAEELKVVGSPKLKDSPFKMLIGRDVLSKCLLVYDGCGESFTLSYEAIPRATP